MKRFSLRSLLVFSGYASWFMLMFVVGVYLTFPVDDLKPLVVQQLEDQLGKGKQGPHGTDPVVTIGNLSLSGLGVEAERARIQFASRDPDPGPTLDVDSLAIGVRPWTLPFSKKTVTFSAKLWDGDIDGHVTIDDKGNTHEVSLDIDDLDLSKSTLVAEKLGVPLAGKLSASTSLELGATPEKDGTGSLRIRAKGLTLGPGNLKLAAAFGGFELPAVDLGNLSVDIPVSKGKGTVENFKLDGKDVQAELDGDISVRSKVQSSRLDLDGWFALTPAFLEREKKFESLLQIGESMGGGASLGKAKDDEGHYYFSVKGTSQSPTAALARDNGKRAKQKSGKATPAAANPAPEPSGG